MIIDLPFIAKYQISAHELFCLQVADGEKHTAQRLQRGLPAAVQMLLRGIAPLHAAAIHTLAGAVVLAGRSAVGKSTLAAGLHERGYGVLADDLTGLQLQDERPYVLPGYAGVTLWKQAMTQLGYSLDAAQQVHPELEKYVVTPETAVVENPVPLRAIFLLSVHNEPEVTAEAVTGMQKFQTVGQNTYNTRWVDEMVNRDQFFALSAAIASSVPVWLIKRPRTVWTLDEVADTVEDKLR